jgi:fused signal recognition particle receptor
MIKTFGQAPPPPTFFEKLKEGLSKSTGALGENITGIFTRKKLDAATLGELEEALIRADMGAAQAAKIAAAVGAGRYEREISDAEIKSILASELTKLLSPVQKPLDIDSTKKPFVILVAGVNGTGKTTTIGKIAKRLTDQGLKLVLAAGDTFRAAAIEQLQVWGQRMGAEVVARAAGADAAGLAYDAIERARATEADVVLIDTAGRLQNKAGLMAELEKIARVIKKLDPSAPHAALLVLDATTGQNAISQVEAFKATVPLTGLVMTKLDGTAKGGILVALAAKFGLPIHFIGVGEAAEDLQPFVAADFARALTGAS